MLADLPVATSPSHGEVGEADDAEHDVVDALAFESAVAEDLPGLHSGEGVLDADADLAVGGVVFLRPGGMFALDGAATLWSRVGTRVPSTISAVSLRNRLGGSSASNGPR